MTLVEAVEVAVPPAERDAVWERLRLAMEEPADHGRYRFELTVAAPGAGAHWLEVRGEVVMDAMGTPTGVRGTVQDITQRRQAEREREASDALLRAIIENTPAGVTLVDDDERFVLVNQAFAERVQMPVEEIVGRLQTEVLPADVAVARARADAQVRTGDAPLTIEERVGDRVHVVQRFGARDVSGHRLVCGVSTDVTELRRSARRLRLQGDLLDAVDAGVVATALDGTVTYWNAGAERLFGLRSDQVLGRHPREFTERTRGRIEALFDGVVRSGSAELEIALETRHRGTIWTDIRGSLWRAEDEHAGLLFVCVDVTDRRAAQAEVQEAREFLAGVTDNMIEGLFVQDPQGHVRYMNRRAEALLGYERADLEGVRVHDVIHHTRADGNPHPWEDCPVSSVVREGRPVSIEDDVFVRKDGSFLPVAWTASPLRNGSIKGVIVVFRDITAQKADAERVRRELDQISWVGRIRDALDQGRFELYAQPILDLHSGAVTQHELLLRMRGHDGEIIAPGEFLATAERYGLVKEIDHWVIGEAVRLAATGQRVEFNLSAASLADIEVSNYLGRMLEQHGADPANLICEITETTVIEDELVAVEFLRRLHTLGIAIALDDFGTGYGGLTFLKHLPVDYLKIDLEFVREILRDPQSRHVVSAVVNLAQGFGKRTIAEGVEQLEALDLLRELGVDHAQGYALGRPQPAAESFGAIAV